MAQILQTTLVDNRAVDAAGETFQVDLSVNPLSVILLTLRALNTATAVSARDFINTFLDKYTNLNVRYRGATVIDGQLRGIAAGMMIRGGWAWQHGQENGVDNDVRSLTIPILFGRKPYDPKECFPATRRGDLILELTADADAGDLDGHSVHVETVELLDASPERYIKFTESAQAMTATGPNTIALPIGNKLLGVLLNPYAYPSGANRTSSFGEINLEVDNVEVMYSGVDWEAAHALFARRVPPWTVWLNHVHGFDDAAAGQTNTQRGAQDQQWVQEFGLLELDPDNDGAYALDTRGAADVSIQINSDTADGANLSRVYPIELVETGAGAGAAG